MREGTTPSRRREQEEARPPDQAEHKTTYKAGEGRGAVQPGHPRTARSHHVMAAERQPDDRYRGADRAAPSGGIKGTEDGDLPRTLILASSRAAARSLKPRQPCSTFRYESDYDQEVSRPDDAEAPRIRFARDTISAGKITTGTITSAPAVEASTWGEDSAAEVTAVERWGRQQAEALERDITAVPEDPRSGPWFTGEPSSLWNGNGDWGRYRCWRDARAAYARTGDEEHLRHMEGFVDYTCPPEPRELPPIRTRTWHDIDGRPHAYAGSRDSWPVLAWGSVRALLTPAGWALLMAVAVIALVAMVVLV